MNYKIKTMSSLFCIFEIQTKAIIEFSSNETTMKSLCKSLNSGAAFDGYTPRFFARSPNACRI
jgi:hypothetical protein